jgi:hypothetical protein
MRIAHLVLLGWGIGFHLKLLQYLELEFRFRAALLVRLRLLGPSGVLQSS